MNFTSHRINLDAHEERRREEARLKFVAELEARQAEREAHAAAAWDALCMQTDLTMYRQTSGDLDLSHARRRGSV
jgi:hypothetical protein